MSKPHVGILHYSVPPVVGGVEAVIDAHLEQLVRRSYPVTVIAGRGAAGSLPAGVEFHLLEQVGSGEPQVIAQSEALETGQVPEDFEALRERLRLQLGPILAGMDCLMVHNVFTKHFNLALSAALADLAEGQAAGKVVAWCHDFTWTSPNSGHKVHPGFPWDILRTRLPGVKYVVVSQRRRETLARLFGCPPQEIQVIYNGVDAAALAGLSPETQALSRRLGLGDPDLVLLMPVRVTQAKNMEYALRVLAGIKAAGWTARLVISGPPDPHDENIMAYYQELRALRAELGLEAEARFVYECGPDPHTPLTIDLDTVGELYRLSDALLMPSHREGFGMPVLEAGYTGLPVFCTPFPAAVEIGGENVTIFDPGQDPATTARQILETMSASQTFRLKQQVRKNYTWEALFEKDILPLLAQYPGHGAG